MSGASVGDLILLVIELLTLEELAGTNLRPGVKILFQLLYSILQ
jgi:hypothetical protein